MKKIINTCIFLSLIVGSMKLALADETKPVTEVVVTSTASQESQNQITSRMETQDNEEEGTTDVIKSAPRTTSPQIRSRGNSFEGGRSNAATSRIHTSRIGRQTENPGTVESTTSEVSSNRNNDKASFTSELSDARREVISTPTGPVIRPRVDTRVEQRGGFSSDVRSPQYDQGSGIVSVQRGANDERAFRERERNERELRVREWQSRQHDSNLSHRERAFRDRSWYANQLKVREWENSDARDQELAYLMWRERQLSRYFWSENGRYCQYVTYYKTGVRTNRRVTVCEWRRGKYTCFHPKRYFIYPVTRLVCYGRYDRRVIGAIVRPYPY